MAKNNIPEILRGLNTLYRKEFARILETTPTLYQKFAMVIPSNTTSNTYGWLGRFPRMQEWLDERTIEKMAAQAMVLVNRKFEATVGVRAEDIEDDNIGLYTDMIREMAMSAAELPDQLVFEALQKGETGICYDGQAFFDKEHPVYPKVSQEGDPEFVSNITEDGDSENAFYLLDTTRHVKPLIYQNRVSPEFNVQNDADKSDRVFMKDEYLYGSRARGAAGYGMWQFAHKVKADLTKDAVLDVRAKMRTIKGDGGRIINVNPNILLVHPNDEAKALELCNADVIAGTTNTLKGLLTPVVAPWLAL